MAKRKYLPSLRLPKPIEWLVDSIAGRFVELVIAPAIIGAIATAWAFFKDLPAPFFVPIGLITAISTATLFAIAVKIKRLVYRVVPEEELNRVEAERNALQATLAEKRPYLSPPVTTSDFLPEKRLFRWSVAFSNNGNAPAFGLQVVFGVSITALPQDFGVTPAQHGPNRLCPGDPPAVFFHMLLGDFYLGQKLIVYARVNYSARPDFAVQDFHDEYIFSFTIGETAYGRPTFLTLSSNEAAAFKGVISNAPRLPETNPPSTTA